MAGKRKKRKNNHRIYALIVLILGLGIIIMSFKLIFHVHKIQITGNEYVDSNEIVETITKDRFTANTLYLVAKGKLGGFDFNPSIDEVRFRMSAPWSVKIEVKEKKIIGSIMYDGEYVYFDKEGPAVYKNSVLLDDVAYIEGIRMKKVEMNKEISFKSEQFVPTVEKLSKSLKDNKLHPDHILYNKKGEFTLVFDEIHAKIGKNNIPDKVANLKPILKKLKGKSGTLDLKHYANSDDTIPFKENKEKAKTQ